MSPRQNCFGLVLDRLLFRTCIALQLLSISRNGFGQHHSRTMHSSTYVLCRNLQYVLYCHHVVTLRKRMADMTPPATPTCIVTKNQQQHARPPAWCTNHAHWLADRVWRKASICWRVCNAHTQQAHWSTLAASIGAVAIVLCWIGAAAAVGTTRSNQYIHNSFASPTIITTIKITVQQLGCFMIGIVSHDQSAIRIVAKTHY